MTNADKIRNLTNDDLAIKTAEKKLMEEVVRETKKAFWRDENESETGA